MKETISIFIGCCRNDNLWRGIWSTLGNVWVIPALPVFTTHTYTDPDTHTQSKNGTLDLQTIQCLCYYTHCGLKEELSEVGFCSVWREPVCWGTGALREGSPEKSVEICKPQMLQSIYIAMCIPNRPGVATTLIICTASQEYFPKGIYLPISFLFQKYFFYLQKFLLKEKFRRKVLKTGIKLEHLRLHFRIDRNWKSRPRNSIEQNKILWCTKTAVLKHSKHSRTAE